MKVLVADDNPVVLRGMQVLLEDAAEVREVLTAADGDHALALLREHPDVDVVCLDVRMPNLGGLDVLREIAGDVPCMMLTHSDEPETIAEALACGARGYLVHGTFGVDELLAALRTCRSGGLVLGRTAATVLLTGPGPSPHHETTVGDELRARLTPREVEIVDGILDGLSNAAIGRRIFVSEKTVKNNLNRVYAKLGFSNRVELVAHWHRPAAA